jgi:predicted O-methyltransferase YrrM
LAQRVESLSQQEQDAIASRIMETPDDEEAWTRSFREKPAVLRSLARELRVKGMARKRP